MRTSAKYFACILIILIAFLAGCGLFVGRLKRASIQANEGVRIQEPLNVTKKEASSIQKIAISNIINRGSSKKSEDTNRLDKADLAALVSELERSKRFDVVSPYQFQRRAKELGALDDISVMSEEELKNETARVAKDLGCDAVLMLEVKGESVDMGGAVGTYITVGTVSTALTTSLELLSSQNSSLWRQEMAATVSSGGYGYKEYNR